MANITKVLAIAIAKKLNAEFIKKKRHDIAMIYYQGRLVAQFGIRRGSKNSGHDHGPNQIYVQSRQARLLGECPLSREDWISIMSDLGHL